MIRRVLLSLLKKVDDVVVCEDVQGVVGEVFDSEQYDFYGISANPPSGSEALNLSINDDPNNHVTLPPQGTRLAKQGSILLYYGDDTDIQIEEGIITVRIKNDNIKIEEGKITATVGNGNITITEKLVSTDMDIKTTGKITANGVIMSEDDVQAGSTSLKNHVHLNVRTGTSVSGKPQ